MGLILMVWLLTVGILEQLSLRGLEFRGRFTVKRVGMPPPAKTFGPSRMKTGFVLICVHMSLFLEPVLQEQEVFALTARL
ncbi:MAG: hypothetical protein A4E56_01838 [Pelotomaculum sp. PtaU1.Bin065]|nr:MAG: hypothetical protein A4E56_01838 [Pelotomaculum sp. PtaU1.Bin065]